MVNSIRLDSNPRTSRANDPIEVKLFFCLVFIIKLTGLKQIIDRVAQETDLGADLLLVSRCKFCNATHYLATQLDSTSEHPSHVRFL